MVVGDLHKCKVAYPTSGIIVAYFISLWLFIGLSKASYLLYKERRKAQESSRLCLDNMCNELTNPESKI